jgi:hypothetical protein
MNQMICRAWDQPKSIAHLAQMTAHTRARMPKLLEIMNSIRLSRFCYWQMIDHRTHAAHPRLINPMAKKISGKPSRKLRLSQVGQVPQSCLTNGLSCPPTIPFRKP